MGICEKIKKLQRSGDYRKHPKEYLNQKNDQHWSANIWLTCGVCPECLKTKANNWMVKNLFQAEISQYIYFITITYEENPYILIKKDLQKFNKRLRKHYKEIPIKYFAIGEYGTIKGRPHYHELIYTNTPIFEDLKYSKMSKKKQKIYKSELLQNKLWGKGICTVQICEDKKLMNYLTLHQSINKKIKDQVFFDELKKLKEIKLSDNAYYNLDDEEKSDFQKKVKSNYNTIREFNLWSNNLGWDYYIDNYYTKIGVQKTIWFNDREYNTPKNWLHRLIRDFGDANAQEILINMSLYQDDTTEYARKYKSNQKEALYNAKRQKTEI